MGEHGTRPRPKVGSPHAPQTTSKCTYTATKVFGNGYPDPDTGRKNWCARPTDARVTPKADDLLFFGCRRSRANWLNLARYDRTLPGLRWYVLLSRGLSDTEVCCIMLLMSSLLDVHTSVKGNER